MHGGRSQPELQTDESHKVWHPPGISVYGNGIQGSRQAGWIYQPHLNATQAAKLLGEPVAFAANEIDWSPNEICLSASLKYLVGNDVL
jgi:hypothetical protein